MNTQINNLAYTAGYIDGDGCIYAGTTVQKKGTIVFEYNIQVLSVNIEPLNYFVNNFGGCIRAKNKKERHKIAYVWTLKKDCIELIKNIYPYLIDKKISCEYFIDYISLIKQTNYQKVLPEILEERYRYITQIKQEKHINDFVKEYKVNEIKHIEHIEPTQTDYCYLAGLIDAEGCFRLVRCMKKNRPNNIYAIRLELANTRFPIFPWIKARFGGSVMYNFPKNMDKPIAIWCISTNKLAQLIPKIIDFLINKKPVAIKIMEFSKTVLPNGGDRHSEQFKTSYKSVLIERDRIVADIHKLNSKGS